MKKNKETEELVQKDLKYIWHPCSQMKDYENFPPIIIDHAKGSYVYDINGKKYLDIISSWWCNLLGHCHPKINEAITKQVNNLEQVIFANFSHTPAINLCEKLKKLLPENLTKFFFSGDGSSAVEVAFKMSFQYHQHTNPKKKKFIALSGSYHGETIGALSLGSLGIYSDIYKPILIEVSKIQGPNCFRCPFNKIRNNCNCECIKYVSEYLDKNHSDVSGIFIEPILQAANEMNIYPPQYLKDLAEICVYYKIHLIFDEIATGFGRTGLMFAMDVANVTPDILCLSKGLTGGYLPMSLTVTTNEIYNCFYEDYNKNKAFLHSHTYSGNALGCAAANAVIDILSVEKIIEKSKEKAIYLKRILREKFKNEPQIGEIRSINLINAIEIVKNRKTKEPFNKSERIGYQIYKEAIRNGLILRPLGDCLYFNPPLTIDYHEIEEAVETTYKSYRTIFSNSI